MAIIQKTLFAENLDRYNTLITDTEPNSKYFKITELPDTFTGGKNAFLIQGSEYLVSDTLIKIEIKDSQGNVIYHEPGEGIVSSSVAGESIVTEYYEGTSKVVAVYIYPDTTYGPATITILGEASSYENNGLDTPIPLDWEGKYNVKWQKQINVNPALPNLTKVRFYRRPQATIREVLAPIYSIVGDNKVASNVTQSFADIKISQLDTFAGDVKRIKVFRTSEGDISDFDLIQDVLLESKELLTTTQLTGSVIANSGFFTSEVLKKLWNTGSLETSLTSARIDNGLKISGSGYFRYTSSINLADTSVYELGFDAFYSGSSGSVLGVYVSGSENGEKLIGSLTGISPTKNLKDQLIQFSLATTEPSASLYFSQSNAEWHIGNISLQLTQDTAFSPSEISFITSMPTVIGNETYNFKFEFYDVNNNYVPVAVTQSATFTGGNNNIGGTLIFISSSASQSLADLNRVSSSISGTIVVTSGSISGTIGAVSSSVSGTIGAVSSSVSGTITNVSSSVSGTITTLSSSVSQSVAYTLSSSLSNVKNLADGNYPGVFIDGTSIYSPVIGGQTGYISSLFKVGTSPSILLDARQNPRKIFIGGAVPGGDTEVSGAFNNANTSVYLDSAGKFSLGDKLSFSGGNLSIKGAITATSLTLDGFGLTSGDVGLGDVQNLNAAGQAKAGIEAAITINSGGIAMGTGGYIRGGQSDYNTGTGFFLGRSGTTYKFSIGDGSTKGITWDGNTLTIGGNAVIGASTIATIADKANAALTSVTSTNVTDALGYTPPSSATVNSANKTAGSVGGWTIQETLIKSNNNQTIFYNTGVISLTDGSSEKIVITKDALTKASTTATISLPGTSDVDTPTTTGVYSHSYMTTWYQQTVSTATSSQFTAQGASVILNIPYGGTTNAYNSGTVSWSTTLSNFKSIQNNTSQRIQVRLYTAGGTLVETKSVTVYYRQDILGSNSGYTFPYIGGGSTSVAFSGLSTGSAYYVIVDVTKRIESVYIAWVFSASITATYTSYGMQSAGPTIDISAAAEKTSIGVNGMIASSAGGFAQVGPVASIGGTAYSAAFLGNVRVNGEIQASSLVSTSDERLKTNIIDIESPLLVIEKLKPKSFVWNNKLAPFSEQKNSFGFIAQDVEKDFPFLVKNVGNSEDMDNVLSLDYNAIIPINTAAIKELLSKIEELEERILELENK